MQPSFFSFLFLSTLTNVSKTPVQPPTLTNTHIHTFTRSLLSSRGRREVVVSPVMSFRLLSAQACVQQRCFSSAAVVVPFTPPAWAKHLQAPSTVLKVGLDLTLSPVASLSHISSLVSLLFSSCIGRTAAYAATGVAPGRLEATGASVRLLCGDQAGRSHRRRSLRK
jgi:hypothetical protein